MQVPSCLRMQEMIIKFLLLGLCLSMTKLDIVEASISVVEVPAGHLAELPCLSSDDFHRFMFWQLNDDKQVIGPGNALDEEKYNYEVLTGKLLIRAVTPFESGRYKCISRGIEDKSAINVHIVDLIVKKDINDLVKHSSFESNLLLGMSIVMVLIVGIAIILLVFMLKRRRSQSFDMMEESRENSPARYVQSEPATPSSSRTLESGGIDNMGLDVDFPKVFNQMQKGQQMPPL